MKRLKQMAALVLGGMIMISAMACNSSSKVPDVDVQTFDSAISKGNVQLLDVRTPEEFAEGHLEGAINIDLFSNDFMRDATSILKKEEPIYVYCRSGRRSKTAGTKLARLGYKSINLDGGIIAWEDAGLPVTTE